MTTSIVNIALTGLRAAQAGLSVTANNISNQSTPGYSRQQLVQQSAFSTFTGTGYFGQGVNVVTVQRAYNDFLTSQASQSASQLEYLSTYSDRMGMLIDRLGNAGSGINASLNNMFAAMSDFSQRPDQAASRQGALDSAQSVATRFRSLSQGLATLGTNVDQQLGSTVGQIDSLLGSIATYNQRIATAMSTGSDNVPNDLLDQRDTLLRQLGKMVGITTSQQATAINVFMEGGQPLVVGNTVSQLKIQQDPRSPTGITISLQSADHDVQLREDEISGGQMGALLQFRNNELASAQHALGKLAIGMVAAYNQQQQFGLDADGQQGKALFAVGSPHVAAAQGNLGDGRVDVGVADTRSLTGDDYDLVRHGSDYVVTRSGTGEVVGTYGSLPQTIEGLTFTLSSGTLADGDRMHVDVTGQAASGVSVLLSDASRLAAAAPMQVGAAASNNGTALASRLRSAQSGSVDYGTSVDVVFTQPGTYEVRDASGTVLGGGTLTPPRSTIALNGWAFDLDGTPAAGDVFSVKADPGDPAGDNRNALGLASLGTARLSGGASLTDGYAAVVASVGTRAASINVSKDAQQASYDQAIQDEQSAAGVNLDEEGAKLIQYQQAYAAAGKVLAMASRLFDELVTSIV